MEHWESSIKKEQERIQIKFKLLNKFKYIFVNFWTGYEGYNFWKIDLHFFENYTPTTGGMGGIIIEQHRIKGISFDQEYDRNGIREREVEFCKLLSSLSSLIQPLNFLMWMSFITKRINSELQTAYSKTYIAKIV